VKHDDRDRLLVSHQPLLRAVVTSLLPVHADDLDFPTAAIAALRSHAGSWSLAWYFTP
jgi:phosphohistidine phosphatase SixA